MKKMKHPRALKLTKNYVPKQSMSDEIEIYPNGIFQFFISKIIEDIEFGTFAPKKERINIDKWRKTHTTSSGLNEEHLQTVDTKKPIIQAEIRIGRFEIIDGNHRFEKAIRDGKKPSTPIKYTVKNWSRIFMTVKGMSVL